ncbi:MAG TPA: TetR/AcrR family transcriptional regulator [Terriglobales bacterium]|jgi:AcrR family transcriptional regulator|nr:TetR/AcrR family transcriptional regulator [Terriglobales bacterium]
MPHRTDAEDRRIQKTQALLKTALVSLIAEKPYDSIVVKEILDRANVGRSTFYTHFRDKDDLLLSGIHEMLGPVPPPTRTGTRQDRLLWFSLPVFEHHYEHAHAWGDRIGTRGRAILHEHLRRVLTDIVADVMTRGSRSGHQPTRQIPAEVVSAYIASTFVLVLNWWLDKRMRMTPKEINDVFLRLISPTLAAAYG